MTSDEIQSLIYKYERLRDTLVSMIGETRHTLDIISGGDTIISEVYIINGQSADNESIKHAIQSINNSLSSFISQKRNVDQKISNLYKELEAARDAELAASLDAASE